MIGGCGVEKVSRTGTRYEGNLLRYYEHLTEIKLLLIKYRFANIWFLMVQEIKATER